jgi:segregation and condensation protein B
MNTESILESLLFISGEPMSFKNLTKIISQKEEVLKLSAESLAKKYAEKNGGLRILIKDGKMQMVTAGENSDVVEKFLKADIEGELSKAALEVLSIVAYRGPISRSEIENIRGVNCSFTLRHLLIRGLAERMSNPNDARAYLYRVSFEFLKNLGVEKVEDLPKFKELKEKEFFGKVSEIERAENEDGQV